MLHKAQLAKGINPLWNPELRSYEHCSDLGLLNPTKSERSLLQRLVEDVKVVKKMDNRELEAFRYDLNEALQTSKPWAQFGHWYDIGGRLPHLSVEQCFLSLSLAFTFDDTAKRLKKVGFDAQEVKEALSAVRLQYYPHHFDPSKLTFFERIGLEGYLSILNSLKPTGLTIAESTLLSTAFLQGIRQYLLAAHEHANKATDVVDEAAEDTSWSGPHFDRTDGATLRA